MKIEVFMQVKETDLTSESFYRGLLWYIYDTFGLMWFYVVQCET